VIKVATTYHHTTSDVDEKPTLKCRGTCQKVYWPHDFDTAVFGEQLRCPKCSGLISAAVEGKDYEVLELMPGKKSNQAYNVLHLSNLHDKFIHLQEKYNWR
jgi:hypothetical protein